MEALVRILPLLLFIGAFLLFFFPWAIGRIARALHGREPRPDPSTFLLGTVNDVVRGIRESESDLRDLYSRAERRASFLDRYHQSILESMSTGVMACNRRGEITALNGAAAAILGLPAEAGRGKRLGELLGPKHPLHRIHFAVAAGEPASGRRELKIRRAGEEARWVELRVSALPGRSGQAVGVIFVVDDVTETKRLHAQVEMKERLAAMGEISAGITHEFRNALQALSGLAKLIARRAAGNERIEPLALEIRGETDRMARILNEMRTYLKPQEIRMEPIRADELVRTVLIPFLEQRGERPIRIRLDVPSDLLPIRGDRALLAQALRNIARNAWEAMSGGGELVVRGRALAPDLGPEAARGARVLLEVADTGPGIPEEIRDKIFHPFFTTRTEGTGLGLPFVQKVIAAHGGTVDVDSRLGEGTCFALCLPAVAPEREEAVTPVPDGSF
ncbi:MAG: PAS domain-containing protein [Candidatus Eisenbacteria bacterium]|nr:PAS domain-containing protein [Candidatus Eisenbacteria bacterium]